MTSADEDLSRQQGHDPRNRTNQYSAYFVRVRGSVCCYPFSGPGFEIGKVDQTLLIGEPK